MQGTDDGDDFGDALLTDRPLQCGCGRRLSPLDDASECMWCGWLADQARDKDDTGVGEA